MVTRLPDLIAWLTAQIEGWKCYGVVPADRPKRFITIERTGGSETAVLDDGQYAVQVWATSMQEAAQVAEQLRSSCSQLLEQSWVAEVRKGIMYNFPDPTSRQARYQFTLNVKTLITE